MLYKVSPEAKCPTFSVPGSTLRYSSWPVLQPVVCEPSECTECIDSLPQTCYQVRGRFKEI